MSSNQMPCNTSTPRVSGSDESPPAQGFKEHWASIRADPEANKAAFARDLMHPDRRKYIEQVRAKHAATMAAAKAREEAAKLRETLAAKHAAPIEGATPEQEAERATLANFYSKPASADMLAKAKMLFAKHADADR
eukprot:3320304-Rhodomonas_salina.1